MTLITGPSPRRASRLGWWAMGGFLALAAAFWLAERIVDLLWMGGLGYRAVFWYILDLRFGLFAVAFVPLVLAFWLNLRWALRVMGGWRQTTGAAIDPVLAELERSVLLRRALPILLALVVAIGFAGLWDDAVRFSLWRVVRRCRSATRPRSRLLPVSAAAARCDRAWDLLCRARAAARPSGARARARGLARLGAARRSHAELDGTGGGVQPRRAGARGLRWLCPRPLPPALRRGGHRPGARLRRRARGDADALADGRDRAWWSRRLR